MVKLFHCFGAKPEHRVDAVTAVGMLKASGCTYLAINTHTIESVTEGGDLPVGYASATFATVRDLVGTEVALTPVLNINHPTTAAEAVARARRASDLTDLTTIKLEVLDLAQRVTRNDEVLAAAADLVADGFEVWPLITADVEAFRRCQDLGVAMVRVMGSPIGARKGIDPTNVAGVSQILKEALVPVMLDGGIGSVDDAENAYRLGFDSILVNSCLFGPDNDPVAALRAYRRVADNAGTSADVSAG